MNDWVTEDRFHQRERKRLYRRVRPAPNNDLVERYLPIEGGYAAYCEGEFLGKLIEVIPRQTTDTPTYKTVD
jgi:hypothetical protein